jgi:uncharacterized protein (TIGR01244 family)
MDIRKVDEGFAVATQLRPEDLPALAAAGYTTVICNRPDGEEHGQPSAEQIRVAAAESGLAFHMLPIAGRDCPVEAVRAFAQLRRAAPGPVVAYCRTGTRAIMLDTLANPLDLPVRERLARASSAGYDLSSLVGRLGE